MTGLKFKYQIGDVVIVKTYTGLEKPFVIVNVNCIDPDYRDVLDKFSKEIKYTVVSYDKFQEFIECSSGSRTLYNIETYKESQLTSISEQYVLKQKQKQSIDDYINNELKEYKEFQNENRKKLIESLSSNIKKCE